MIQGLVLLLVFTPLAFGTVEPWSISIMELGAFGLFFLHVGSRGISLPGRLLPRAAAFLFLLLTGLVLLQLLPLPDSILGWVSPTTLAIWRQFGGETPGAFHTLSLCPDATRQELLKLLAYAAVFIVVARHFRTRAHIMILVKTILATGGFLAVLAIAQRLTWNGRLLWFYPVEESLRSGFRIWGPYVNHNHFACYLELALPLGLGLLLFMAPEDNSPPRGGWIDSLGRFLASRNLVPFAGIFLLVLLMAACLLATLSRGALVASALAWLTFMGMTWRRRTLRRKALRLTLAAAVLCAAILLPAWDRIAQRFEDIEEKNQVSRLYVLEDSLGIVADFPLFGTGLGTFEQGYRRYQARYPNLIFDHAHNDYLEMLTDTGTVGFLLAAAMAALFSLSLIRGWRGRHSRFSTCIGAGGICSCLAMAVHGGADFNLHIPANALLFAVIAGLTHAAIFIPSAGGGAQPAPDAAPQHRSSTARLFPRLGVIPLACLLLYFPARALLADHRHRQVARILDDEGTEELDVKAIAAGTIPDYLKAIDSLKSAAALEPSRATYPQELSTLYANLAEWALTMESLHEPLPAGAFSGKEALTLAAAETQRAIALDPTNPGLHLALGRLLAAVDGDLARADAQILLAVAAHPASARIRHAAAMIYLLSGSKARALEQATVLAGLDDSYRIAASAQKTYQIERRARPYLARLKASYLFSALEIAWRASGDITLVKALTPPNDDARAVLELFLEWKGLDE